MKYQLHPFQSGLTYFKFFALQDVSRYAKTIASPMYQLCHICELQGHVDIAYTLHIV